MHYSNKEKLIAMKKYNIAIAALLSAAALVSCQKEIEETRDNRKETETETVDGLTFKAVAGDITKTSIDGETGKVTWTNWDAISIFDGTGAKGKLDGYTNDKKYVNTLESGSTAVFKPNTEDDRAVEGAAKYYAMCPRDSDACCDVTNGVFDFWLVDCQKGNKDGFSDARATEGKHMNYSVAMTTDPENNPLVFHNAVTQLKIEVPEFLAGKVTHIAIIPLGGEYIAGDTEVVLDDSGNITTVVGRYAYNDNGTGSKYPAVYLFPDYNKDRYAISGATFEAGTYYAAIRNTALSKGLLIEYRNSTSGTAGNVNGTVSGTVVTSKDVIACKRTGSAITLERAHLYNMGSFGDKPSSAPAATGITGLPYSFSFYCNTLKDGDLKYITAGSLTESDLITMGAGAFEGYLYKQQTGVVATENDPAVGASLSFSTVSYYKNNSEEKTAKGGLYFYKTENAHDNVNTCNFCTRDGIDGLPFECGAYLSVPLQTNLPSSFYLSFGLALQANGWGVNNWAAYYSNDNVSWIKAGETVTVEDYVKNASNYYYFQVKAETPEAYFRKGGMLYLKLAPVGYTSVGSKGARCNGFGTSCATRFHSAITISAVEVEKSSAVSGAAISEGFDSFNGGLDYFIGDRLAAMANLCGSEGSLSGYTLSNVYQRPGYAQIGFVNSQTMAAQKDMTTKNLLGSLTTPAVGKAGNLTLSFKACAYRSPAARTGVYGDSSQDWLAKSDGYTPDITTIRLSITGGGTIDGATTVDIADISTSGWQTITKTITGATADTKIEFTSPTDGLFHRWFLDDICVK